MRARAIVATGLLAVMVLRCRVHRHVGSQHRGPDHCDGLDNGFNSDVVGCLDVVAFHSVTLHERAGSRLVDAQQHLAPMGSQGKSRRTARRLRVNGTGCGRSTLALPHTPEGERKALAAAGRG